MNFINMAIIKEIAGRQLAEDLRAFLSGADVIEEGISLNDSDSIIHGNVTIRRILGRRPQFTGRAEFDDLMGSKDALILLEGICC